MLTVITGPPCAGKSTYLGQHARPGDIRIDFDDLAQAFGSPVRHGHADPVWRVTVAARAAAIDQAIEWHKHRGTRVWIIDTAPTARRLEQYRKAGARIVTLTAPPEELHRRAAAERPPGWRNRIDQWLATGGQAVPAMNDRPHARPGIRGGDPQPQSRTTW